MNKLDGFFFKENLDLTQDTVTITLECINNDIPVDAQFSWAGLVINSGNPQLQYYGSNIKDANSNQRSSLLPDGTAVDITTADGTYNFLDNSSPYRFLIIEYTKNGADIGAASNKAGRIDVAQ